MTARFTLSLVLTSLAILAVPAQAHHKAYRPLNGSESLSLIKNDGHGHSEEKRDNGRSEHHDDDHDDDHHQNRHHNDHDDIHFDLKHDSSLALRFGSDDLNLIVNWSQGKTTVTSQEWDDLPPGLCKQIRERGHLPPGLKMKTLPPGLAKRLGHPPHGYDRVVIGHDVVMIELATGAIADVIHDIF